MIPGYVDHDYMARILHDPRATIGLVCDFARSEMSLETFSELARADQWRGAAALAAERRACLIACGRPFTKNAGGFFALASDVETAAAGMLAAHVRMAETGSTATAWTLLCDGALRDTLMATLAQLCPAGGAA